MPKKSSKRKVRETAKKRVAKLIPKVRKAAKTKHQKEQADQLTGVARSQGVKVGKIRGRVSERAVAQEEAKAAQRTSSQKKK